MTANVLDPGYKDQYLKDLSDYLMVQKFNNIVIN